MQHSITLLGQMALTQPGGVLGHCPVEKQRIVPLSANQKSALNSKYIIDSVTGKAPPHHHTSSSMLRGGNHTGRDHPITYSVSHKYCRFGLIRPPDTFPLVSCPLLMFLGPSKSLLLIEVL